jgi:hypothetical protein
MEHIQSGPDVVSALALEIGQGKSGPITSRGYRKEPKTQTSADLSSGNQAGHMAG